MRVKLNHAGQVEQLYWNFRQAILHLNCRRFRRFHHDAQQITGKLVEKMKAFQAILQISRNKCF
jgi:hypothetical protein